MRNDNEIRNIVRDDSCIQNRNRKYKTSNMNIRQRFSKTYYFIYNKLIALLKVVSRSLYIVIYISIFSRALGITILIYRKSNNKELLKAQAPIISLLIPPLIP